VDTAGVYEPIPRWRWTDTLIVAVVLAAMLLALWLGGGSVDVAGRWR
jgi:hypothetical protein